MINTHHHIAEHVDQASVRVIRKARISRAFRESLNSLVGETEVEHGVHHAWHRHCRARTHRDQQRVFVGAELLARLTLEHLDVLAHVIHQTLGQLAAEGVIVRARVGGDGESRWNRKPNRNHVCEIRTLAAEQHLLRRVALTLSFAEVKDHLGGLRDARALERLGL